MKMKNNSINKLKDRLDKCKDTAQKIAVLLNLSDYYLKNNQYNLSKEFAEKTLRIAEENNQLEAVSKASYIIGMSYIELSLYDLAMEYLIKSLEIAKQLVDKTLIQSILNGIGIVYWLTGDSDKALDCFQSIITNDVKSSAPVYHNIGSLYKESGDYHKALEYFTKAVSVSKKHSGNQIGILTTRIEIAESYLMLKNYDKALTLFNECLITALKEDIIESSRLFDIHIGFSKIYFYQGNKSKYLHHFLEAEKSVEKIKDDHNRKESYLFLSKFCEEMNKFDIAIDYYKKYAEINKNIFNADLAFNLAQVQDRFELLKKEMELEFNKKIDDTAIEMKERLCELQEVYADVVGLNNIGFFSDAMNRILLLTQKFHNNRNIPVLIEGETGSGKEIIARLIHCEKENSATPFISVNCSAISPSLFESELFGYEGGAFTGAKEKGMPGKLELAQGGTLFLDEIGDLPLDLQPKLLRVIQEKNLYRIGGVEKINLDIRIICATNHDLNLLIEQGKFRSDLYYRLNAGYVRMPPLRERKEEILPLAQMFLSYFTDLMNKKFIYFDKDAEIYLVSREWKGNVRELKNTIQRAVLVHDELVMKKHHLIDEFTIEKKGCLTGNCLLIPLDDDETSLSNIEKEIIKQLLERFRGNKTKTAEYLNITRVTLNNKLKER